MIAEILPLIRFPRSHGIFDYRVPPELTLQPGQIVRMPFGRRRLFGIVWKLKKTSGTDSALKEIESVYEQMPPVPTAQLELIARLAKHYFVSPTLFASLCVPEGLERKVPQPRQLQSARLPKLSKLDQSVVHFLKRKKDALLLTPRQDYLSIVARLICQTITAGQHAIIVPDMARLERLRAALPASLQKTTVLVHSKLSKGALVQAYAEIATSPDAVIIGTRRAIFSPFRNLQNIWLIDEDDPSHKQYDLNPRFDTGTVAELLGTLTKAKVLRTSLSPSIATWSRFRSDRASIMRLGSFTPIHYISTTDPGVVLPPTVENEISERVAKKQKVFILTQQRGEASSIRCGDCGFVITCPACQAVISRASFDVLACKRCGQTISDVKVCPRCKSTRLKDTGLTPARLAARLKTALPGVSISTVTRGGTTNLNDSVLIGTEHVLSRSQQFDYVVVASLEQLLSRPSFDSEFRAWQLLMRVRTIAPAVTILGNAESHPLISALVSDAWSAWYQSLWQQRDEWHYPPPWHVLKFMYRHTDETKAKETAATFATTLRQRLPRQIEIVGPFTRFPYRTAQMYRYALLVRWRAHTPAPDLDFFTDPFFDDWQVDVNPLDAS